MRESAQFWLLGAAVSEDSEKVSSGLEGKGARIDAMTVAIRRLSMVGTGSSPASARSCATSAATWTNISLKFIRALGDREKSMPPNY